MVINKQIRFMVMIFIVGVIMGTLSSIVMASSATSIKKSYSVNGYHYFNQATIHAEADNYVTAVLYAESAYEVPAGYIGVNARLYKNTSLCTSTGMSYNGNPIYGMGISTGGACGSGSYKANGVSAAWNGTSYNTYDSYDTPFLPY
ncbi:hypothetical protein [Paenibacillus sp. 32O-W]|uniref:hypothetical protein n=1 Tax=Paenibacillus sp. 32O-W TaxID=1695218 RepID=UPI0011A7EAAE|nr:hypothetical protein [Paenibacillus sp. 32O-W]